MSLRGMLHFAIAVRGFDAIQDHIKFSPAVFPKKYGYDWPSES